MAALPRVPRAGAGATSRYREVAGDVRAIFVVGGPLIVNNLSSIGVSTADTLMTSRLGPVQLAGVAIGSGLWIALFLLGLGTIMALGPTVAQHFGAGRDAEIGHDTRQGMWLGAVVSAFVIVAMRQVGPLLAALGIEPEVSRLAEGYLDALSWGVPAAYGYHALKQMNEGVGRTIPIMVVMGVALPINVLLNYALIYGRFGLPPLGAVGCGLGNGISFWIMFAMLAGHVAWTPYYRRFRIWRAIEPPDFAALGRLFGLGAPIGLSLFLQSGLFTMVALLMGQLGTAAIAAHQVVLNYSGLVFMVPLGLAMALTVRVGQAVGRGDPAGARRVGLTGLGLCAAITLVSGTTTLWFAEKIAAAYSGDADVVELCLALFRVAAWLQIGDGIQVAAAFALRGFKDTRVPLLINAANYWGVGFGLAYGLGIVLGQGAEGIWIGLTAALWSAGAMLIARFLLICRRATAASVSLRPHRNEA